MKPVVLTILCITASLQGNCWGFYAHKLINSRAVFLLPPEMVVFFKPNINYITDHAVDPDKRRYAVPEEGARHYIDLDQYKGAALPKTWAKAVEKFSEDTLRDHGVSPWWMQVMMNRLTKAFRQKDAHKILKLSAETGHYIADAHVPLHTSSNHNGQLTNQHGIHAFWESRIPELFAESSWDLLNEKAVYVKDPLEFGWVTVYDSFAATDSVLSFEKLLNNRMGQEKKYAFEDRNGQLVKQYSFRYSKEYDKMLGDMVERRMRRAIFAVASLWYTAWVDAGQPDLKKLGGIDLPDSDQIEMEKLDSSWRAGKLKGRSCD